MRGNYEYIYKEKVVMVNTPKLFYLFMLIYELESQCAYKL